MLIEPGGLRKHISYLLAIISAKEDYVVTRYSGKIGLFFFPIGLIFKVRNQKLIIDVPTPVTNLIREMKLKEHKNCINVIERIMIIALGSIPFLSSASIIQYADESKWFSNGVRNRIIKIGNGIDSKSILLRKSAPQWPSDLIILIGVGTIAKWHGYDRIIRAIKDLKDDIDYNIEIRFNIIGEGPEVINLQKIVKSFGLSNQIKFFGMLYEDELYSHYENAHFGIGSLGWSRVGVKEASPIKVREYLAAGLPVITATEDPDFDDNLPLFHRVSDGEEIESIIIFFKNIKSIIMPTPLDCRLYAENKLDFKVKVKRIISEI